MRREKQRPVSLFKDIPDPNTEEYGTFARASTPNGNRDGNEAARRHGTAGSQAGDAEDTDLNMWQYMTSPQSPFVIQVREHCQHQALAAFLAFLLLLLVLYMVFGQSSPAPSHFCTTPFGIYLGESHGVAAYSNCNHLYLNTVLPHYVSVGLQREYAGDKWHAMEYARRYWMLTRLLTLPPVDEAYALPNLSYARYIKGPSRGQRVLLTHLYNLPGPESNRNDNGRVSRMVQGDYVVEKRNEDKAAAATMGSNSSESTIAKNTHTTPNNVPLREWVLNRHLACPIVGDLIVYAKHRKTLPRGHVAVVVEVRGPFRDWRSLLPSVQQIYFLDKNPSKEPQSPEKTVSDMEAAYRARIKSEEEDAAASTSTSTSASTTATTTATPSKPNANKANNAKAGAAGQGVMDAEVAKEQALYYEVYIAEQNWENQVWVDRPVKSFNPKTNNNRKYNATNSAAEEDDSFVLQTRNLQKLSFSRVLLLREYYPSRNYYLQDTLNNVIIEWVRPNEKAGTVSAD